MNGTTLAIQLFTTYPKLVPSIVYSATNAPMHDAHATRAFQSIVAHTLTSARNNTSEPINPTMNANAPTIIPSLRSAHRVTPITTHAQKYAIHAASNMYSRAGREHVVHLLSA